MNIFLILKKRKKYKSFIELAKKEIIMAEKFMDALLARMDDT